MQGSSVVQISSQEQVKKKRGMKHRRLLEPVSDSKHNLGKTDSNFCLAVSPHHSTSNQQKLNPLQD